ncbi:MAG: lysine-2,3-aminomutase-like protein [Gammaproteobacteria bacterium]
MAQAGLIDPAQQHDVERVAREFAVGITAPMLDLIDPADPHDPIGAQFVPSLQELAHQPDERDDPIGDAAHSPISGIVHRYPDRVLLTPVRICAVYCRFCFRRENVGQQHGALLSQAELDSALDYIRSDPNIWEVILSGGDPLLLSTRRLDYILAQLRQIEHVKVIRIHSRVPLVSPAHITKNLSQCLRKSAPLYVVLHCNHPKEFTPAGERAIARLVDAGIPLLSQSVLLRAVNDDADTLRALLRRCVENRVKPYYLHHCDLARGTGHFRTSIKHGQQLMEKLRGQLSGICQPQYVLDIPGGWGKSPIGPGYIRENTAGGYTVSDYTGSEHEYVDVVT